MCVHSQHRDSFDWGLHDWSETQGEGIISSEVFTLAAIKVAITMAMLSVSVLVDTVTPHYKVGMYR